MNSKAIETDDGIDIASQRNLVDKISFIAKGINEKENEKILKICSNAMGRILSKNISTSDEENEDKLRNELASLCHEQWSGWMRYLFDISKTNKRGTVTIPKWAVDRWTRQIETPYFELSKTEQASDKKEADKFLRLINIYKED